MAKITPNDFHDETKYRGIPGFRDFKIREIVFPASFFFFILQILFLRNFFSFSSGYLGLRKSNSLCENTQTYADGKNDFHDETRYRGIPVFCDFKN